MELLSEYRSVVNRLATPSTRRMIELGCTSEEFKILLSIEYGIRTVAEEYARYGLGDLDVVRDEITKLMGEYISSGHVVRASTSVDYEDDSIRIDFHFRDNPKMYGMRFRLERG